MTPNRTGPATLLFAGAAAALAAVPATASAQQDVSSGGRVESDLWTHAENPPAALLDGNISTHFCQHRLEDSDWRVWFPLPARVQRVSFVQGWGDWAQAVDVRLEMADGSTVDLTLAEGTREEQVFELDLQNPTAFVDVYVATVRPGGGDNPWGGFAEMRFEGEVVQGDRSPPVISDVTVEQASETEAVVRWTTDEPATTQLRYSTRLSVPETTAPDLRFTTDHSVQIQAQAELSGQLEIRSADQAGNRARVRSDAFVTIDTRYQYGVGGFSFQIDGQWVRAPELFARDRMEVDFAQQWIGGQGWTDWFTSEGVRELHDAGYIPEVIHYYFGDPTLEDVLARSGDFLEDIRTLSQILAASGVGDRVMVTLEPEYNQNEVATWEGWNDLMIQAIDILRTGAGCMVGLLPGDWDIDHVTPISMGRAAAYADFVAFQEMRASTRNEKVDAYEVADRAVRFSHYLSRKFLRPVRLGYVMVSDYGGWTEVQRSVVAELCERRDELEEAGVTAVSWMSYMDRPSAGGYFGTAEAHKGLKYSDNDPKPAFFVFRECVANGPTWLTTGQWPPGGEPVEEDARCGCSCRAASGAPPEPGLPLTLLFGCVVLWLRMRLSRGG